MYDDEFDDLCAEMGLSPPQACNQGTGVPGRRFMPDVCLRGAAAAVAEAGAGESRSTATAACVDTDNNNLELERHRSLSTEEPQVGLDRVVPPRIQIHAIPGRLVARRLRFVQIIFKIRRHSE